MAEVGHNSGVAELSDNVKNVTGERIRSFIERWERMDKEKKTIAEDQKEIFAEAKGEGFDVKTLRAIIKIRKQDAADREESESILEVYMGALGML